MEEAKKEEIIRPKLTPVYDLIEGAVKVWWKNLLKFVKVYLWGILFTLIPLVVGVILFSIGMSAPQTPSFSLFGANVVFISPFFFLTFICFLFVIYFSVRSYIGMFLVVKNNYEGKALKTYKETRKYFWSYFWLTILTGVLIFLWALLLIIPGIIFSIFYSFAVYTLFFEDLKGMKAIRRSTHLVKGYWWAVTGRFIVFCIALYIFTMIISIPLQFTAEKSAFFYFWSSIMQILNFLIGPISLLFFYQIYQDLVKIKK